MQNNLLIFVENQQWQHYRTNVYMLYTKRQQETFGQHLSFCTFHVYTHTTKAYQLHIPLTYDGILFSIYLHTICIMKCIDVYFFSFPYQGWYTFRNFELHFESSLRKFIFRIFWRNLNGIFSTNNGNNKNCEQLRFD